VKISTVSVPLSFLVIFCFGNSQGRAAKKLFSTTPKIFATSTHPHRKFIIRKVDRLTSPAVVPQPRDSRFLKEKIKTEHCLQQVIDHNGLSQLDRLAVFHELWQKNLRWI
jgi:hypothetical protein